MNARTDAIRQIAQSHPDHQPPATEIDTIFGCDVFSLDILQKRLPKPVFRMLKATIARGERLDPDIADTVACAMKDWAISKGATHYTHWFQPMTGLTAEKHDAFLPPTGEGRIINEFSGKMLICGEPDASSFPSGGLRSTFEARGYTAWDPTVPAFIIGRTLHVPTLFYSYSGEALDRKIPLMRSISALSRQALRILRLFGNDTAIFVRPSVGPEQEYFLVDRRLAALRPDLLLAGRTLMGTPPAKGQEMEDHYFGSIPARVMAFMQDVEDALFRLGIPAKTRHNEVAPGQFEIAPIYEDANIATDHNMLIMNLLHEIAPRHDFICLLHEKPFAGVNGSGKHNNWSISDSEGNNLLDPGKTPLDNAQFLVFLAAVLRAVHKHSAALQELLPRLFREHQAVVFNGNGYSEEWPVEAARRGLPNLATTVDALERYNTPEVMDVFLRQNVLSEREMLARQEILLDTYAKTIAIEASLMLDMSRTQILPVALQEQAAAADLVLKTRAVSTEAAMEEERFTCLRGHTVGLNAALSALEQQLAALRAAADAHTAARIARDGVVPAMQACREHCDALERMLNAAVWPLPSYAEMLWLH